jgi:hypothetical protein
MKKDRWGVTADVWWPYGSCRFVLRHRVHLASRSAHQPTQAEAGNYRKGVLAQRIMTTYLTENIAPP